MSHTTYKNVKRYTSKTKQDIDRYFQEFFCEYHLYIFYLKVYNLQRIFATT